MPGDQPLADQPLADQPFVDRPFVVTVTRSAKRKRTVGARLVGDVLNIVVPSWMSRAEQARWVETMTARFQRRRSTDRFDLGPLRSSASGGAAGLIIVSGSGCEMREVMPKV